MLSRMRREALLLAIATAIGFVPVVWTALELWNPHGELKTLASFVVAWFVLAPGFFVLSFQESFIGAFGVVLIAILVEFVWLFLLGIPLRLMFVGGATVARRLLGIRKNQEPR